jgi:isopenicillin-N N-acyltransferase-like protein
MRMRMQAFVNVGFSGTVSLVTGASSAPLALSQIGVSNPDSSFGPQRNGRGIPFVFLLRDLLQDQRDLDGVRTALQAANRTLDLILGFGAPNKNVPSSSTSSSSGGGGGGGGGGGRSSSSSSPFVGVQYAADQVRFYDDKNMLPVNATWHPHVEDAGACVLRLECVRAS